MDTSRPLSSRTTWLLRILSAWLLLVTLVGWLPLIRSLFDGDTYEWGSGRWFGTVFRGAGLEGDLWFLALKTSVGLTVVVALLRRWLPVAAYLALAVASLHFASDIHTLMTIDEPLIFHGDTLGVRANITVITPIVSAVALLTALALLASLKGVLRTGPQPLAPSNRRAVWVLSAVLPIQFVLLRFGEPHGASDAVGVLLTMAQWAAVGYAFRLTAK